MPHITGLSRRTVMGVMGATAFGLPAPPVFAASKIQAGYLPVASSTPVYFGASNFWEGTELEVEPARLQAGPAIIQAIQGGSIPVGEVACTVALSFASRGIPIITLASVSQITRRFPFNRIMVAKNSSIGSIADLRGKTVGVLGIGTIDHLELLIALKAASLEPADVRVLTIPVPNQPQVLASGQIDAVMMPPPADSVAELNFGARTLADATDSLAYIPLECLVADQRWAERNPGLVQPLIVGWLRASRWIETNKSAARASAQRTLNLAPEIASAMRLPYWSPNGLPIMPGIWNLYLAMVDTKLIEPSPDPDGMMKRYFVDPTEQYTIPALQELGRLPDEETAGLRKLETPISKEKPRGVPGSLGKGLGLPLWRPLICNFLSAADATRPRNPCRWGERARYQD